MTKIDTILICHYILLYKMAVVILLFDNLRENSQVIACFKNSCGTPVESH